MLKFSEFKKHIKEGKFFPVYLLMGDDAFLVKSAFDMLVSQADLKELNVSAFDDTCSVSQITEAYDQLPLMSKYRIISCEFENKQPSDVENILKHIKQYPNPSVIAIFKASAPSAYITKNSDAFELVDCNRLAQSLLLGWLAAQSEKCGVSITRQGAEMLISCCNGYLTRINTEFKKLADTAFDGVIDDKLVKELVSADTDFKIYELSEAIAKKNVSLTFDVYDQISDENAAVSIIGALYSHFRRLLYCAVTSDKENLYRYLNVKPFAIEMASRQAKLYTPLKLKSICDKLSCLDADIKSGRTGDKVALDGFIAQMLCF